MRKFIENVHNTADTTELIKQCYDAKIELMNIKLALQLSAERIKSQQKIIKLYTEQDRVDSIELLNIIETTLKHIEE